MGEVLVDKFHVVRFEVFDLWLFVALSVNKLATLYTVVAKGGIRTSKGRRD